LRYACSWDIISAAAEQEGQMRIAREKSGSNAKKITRHKDE
jgi:hypothetical protein